MHVGRIRSTSQREESGGSLFSAEKPESSTINHSRPFSLLAENVQFFVRSPWTTLVLQVYYFIRMWFHPRPCSSRLTVSLSKRENRKLFSSVTFWGVTWESPKMPHSEAKKIHSDSPRKRAPYSHPGMPYCFLCLDSVLKCPSMNGDTSLRSMHTLACAFVSWVLFFIQVGKGPQKQKGNVSGCWVCQCRASGPSSLRNTRR